MILVPYFPWKLSHRHHHKFTGNIDKDEIFYPVRERDSKKGGKERHFMPFFGFGFGWFFYLICGYSPRISCHVNPWDPMFINNVVACIISLACTVGWILSILALYASIGFTFSQFLVHYIGPIFVFGSWLVVTTFLHHQVINKVFIKPKYATLRYSTLLYTTLLYTTLLYSTLRYSTLLYAILLYAALLYAVIRCPTLLYDTLRYSTLLYATLLYANIRYSTLIYATLRYFTQLYATLRYSTLLYATLRYSTLLYATLCYSQAFSTLFLFF
jgi:hypothetical protein